MRRVYRFHHSGSAARRRDSITLSAPRPGVPGLPAGGHRRRARAALIAHGSLVDHQRRRTDAVPARAKELPCPR
ncbi:hypothetical protein MICRO80W_180180 [Micrococcus luteus]|nr:hypothetical protein MICRO80W_180180 [Micrococcus luteus]